LAKKGFKIWSIDIDNSNCKYENVINYDGINIPFKNSSFDLIISSNVLEHVEDLESLNREMRRVLKKNGKMIHIVPSITWRLITYFNHYIYYLLQAINRIISINQTKESKKTNIKSPRGGYWKYLVPSVHGTSKNAITEIFDFSKYAWKIKLSKYKISIIKITGVGIIYSGFHIFQIVNVKMRIFLSKLFGSSAYVITCIYVD
jgi:SAM-dependent methyltransferase